MRNRACLHPRVFLNLVCLEGKNYAYRSVKPELLNTPIFGQSATPSLGVPASETNFTVCQGGVVGGVGVCMWWGVWDVGVGFVEGRE